ncbi:hypothetical protein EGJ86_07390 [Pseudomonas sp. o96-267]|uniref:hypothetical protein n=1 Tax=Pseudomonas sp. o96-267 TaxID=2479853 RepID=UPI000F787490|nr:hypothetical protein [Pseudomonas sp. o96-267]RRV41300.1 hypothetical protein EGJ86_07390 [Pseudomonas sp. o96-267]
MSTNNDELRQIVTDALVGMISGVTGLVPPTGPGSIPDFVQAPIDREVEKISAGLLAAGSAVEEVEPIGYAWINRYNQAVDHVAPFPPTDGGVSYGERLMTVSQHERIVAGLSAQQPGAGSMPDAARLDFMLDKWRKVVCELLPHDNFEVYVEEGFMGDKRYPGVRYSGEWNQGTPQALEIQREAIDAAITSQGKKSGGDV